MTRLRLAPLVFAPLSFTLACSGASPSGSMPTAATPTAATTAASRCSSITQGSARFGTTVSVTCDDAYAYVASQGLPSHQMMNGITASNQQVPLPQDFTGGNAWKIPLNPVRATQPVSYDIFNGPIGVAVNGVPIFNPDRPGNTGPVDTKVGGELDVCNGHAGRADDYHYHAAPTCMMADIDAARQPLGWAVDGYGIYGFTRADGSTPARDACGGETDPATGDYRYHATAAYPYLLGCFTGAPVSAAQMPKTTPVRPPGNPVAVTNVSLTSETEGWQRMTYTTSTGTSAIRYRQVSPRCWDFQFVEPGGRVTPATYCR